MIERNRYLACFLGGLLIAIPVFWSIGRASGDVDGGPLAAGISAGLGLGTILSAFLHAATNRR
jgi:hypothetical protein